MPLGGATIEPTDTCAAARAHVGRTLRMRAVGVVARYPGPMRWHHWIAVSALAAGCDKQDRSAGADDLYMGDDVPSGHCMGETGPCDTDGDEDAQGDSSGASPKPAGGTCEATMQCDVGLTCMATFDGDIGEFECQSSCIEDEDESRWCIDDESCCNAGSVCSPRGYCRAGDAEETSGEASSSGSDSDDDGSTSTGESTDTGA